jgi:hypothetical protein
MVSVVAQLISNKMAGWGAQGTIGLLMLLNAGFAFGYFCARQRPSGRRRGLRDSFARRVTSTSRYVGPMAPDERRSPKEVGRQLQLRPANWQKRVSVDNAASLLHSSAYPESSGRFPAKRSKLLSCLRPCQLGDFRFRREWRLRSALVWKCADRGPAGDFRPWSISASLAASPAVLSGSRVSCS